MPSRASFFASAGAITVLGKERACAGKERACALAAVQDAVDLDQGAARQARYADRGARRIRLAHVLRHDLVDLGEVAEVGEIYGHAHRPIETEPRRLGDRGEVPEHPVDLRLD